jgi:phospholipase/lecithinase/hemolysin
MIECNGHPATSNDTLVQGFTGPNSTIAVPSALDQLAVYLSAARTSDIHKSLFIILIGANDVFFDPNVTAKTTVENVANIIEKLEKEGEHPLSWFIRNSQSHPLNIGAHKFLLASYPDLSILPSQASTSPEGIKILHDYSSSLDAEIAKLATSRKHVAHANVFGFFQHVLKHPRRFGFDPSVIGKSCLTGVYLAVPRTLCENPDEYVFWDEYHVRSSLFPLFQPYFFDL